LEAGEEICAKCGLVISDEIINTGPEWRAFSSAEKRERSRARVSMTKDSAQGLTLTGMVWAINSMLRPDRG